MAEKIWPPSSAFRGRVPDLDAEIASLKARLAVFTAIIKDEQNKVAVLTDTIEVQREENASMRAEAGRRFDANNEEMVRLETGRRMLKEALRRTQQERDTMRDALKAVEETEPRIVEIAQERIAELSADNARLRADRDEVKAALLAMAGREYATMLDEVHALIGQRQAALELAEQESVRSHSIIKMLAERE